MIVILNLWYKEKYRRYQLVTKILLLGFDDIC